MSNDINLVVASGRLGAAPNRVGSACNFSIACNNSWKDKESGDWVNKVTWINCVAWGKFGAMINDVYKKGDLVTIQGSLGENKWEEKNSGEEKTRAVITITKMDKLGGRQGAGNAPAPDDDYDGDGMPF